MDVRCGRCSKLLARAEGIVEIKCPRCGCMNHWRASVADHGVPSPESERRERHQHRKSDDAKKPTGMAGRQEPPGRSDH
ncbi:Com family DNA-binding transcriptional regulator [Ottowia sp.]|uniref:Com family DNA-binding transcriptional regulator n=1 Tax=Ottowia sp. TaxID=1898956 RepID=UPI0025E175DA|nr:Com family DNA-binding transcriptional regulator [Ottowia sp.]